MTGSSHPPRRPLATFLRKGAPPAAPVGDSPATGDAETADVGHAGNADAAGVASAEAQAVSTQPAHAEANAEAEAEADLDHGLRAQAVVGEPTATDAPVPTDGAPAPATADARRAPAQPRPDAVARAFDAMDSERASDPGAPSQPDTSHTAPQAPSFMLPIAQQPAPRWHWGLIAALTAALLVQIAVADRARLAADAGTRPWVSALCTVLRCSLPPWQEPAAFTMLSREIRPATDQPGALLVKASFRNDARWPQAWPQLKLALSDADGRTIGSNVFMPEDYLGRAPADAPLLDPGQSAQVSFRVREPAAATVAFTFDFQ